jgi:hypothetical protein
VPVRGGDDSGCAAEASHSSGKMGPFPLPHPGLPTVGVEYGLRFHSNGRIPTAGEEFGIRFHSNGRIPTVGEEYDIRFHSNGIPTAGVEYGIRFHSNGKIPTAEEEYGIRFLEREDLRPIGVKMMRYSISQSVGHMAHAERGAHGARKTWGTWRTQNVGHAAHAERGAHGPRVRAGR